MSLPSLMRTRYLMGDYGNMGYRDETISDGVGGVSIIRSAHGWLRAMFIDVERMIAI